MYGNVSAVEGDVRGTVSGLNISVSSSAPMVIISQTALQLSPSGIVLQHIGDHQRQAKFGLCPIAMDLPNPTLPTL
jgi:hypothetical protein